MTMSALVLGKASKLRTGGIGTDRCVCLWNKTQPARWRKHANKGLEEEHYALQVHRQGNAKALTSINLKKTRITRRRTDRPKMIVSEICRTGTGIRSEKEADPPHLPIAVIAPLPEFKLPGVLACNA